MKRIKAKEMFIPRVLNKYSDAEEIKSLRPDQKADISRNGKWGNPYPLRKGATDKERNENLLQYSEWLMLQKNLLDSIGELTGKCLLCTCKPKACHGDILLVLANPPKPFKLKTKKEKKIKRVVTRTKAVDIESEGKQIISRIKSVPEKNIKTCNNQMIKVRVDIHSDPGTRFPEEREIGVPKEDELSALDVAINKSANWSKYDELWHMGAPSYNKESFKQSNDRVRLYYEWKYSYPDPDVMKSVTYSESMAGFFAGFMVGRAYAQDQITTEQITAWKEQRAKYRKLDQQDHTYGDDIPF